MSISEKLYKILSDGKEHSAKDLIISAQIKDEASLKMFISKLRHFGSEIKPIHIDGRLYYQMKKFKDEVYWPCMVLKRDLPMCYGCGCRHKETCGAVPKKKSIDTW